jgi:hypothetical protein
MAIDLTRCARIAQKRQEDRESLTDAERAYFHKCMTEARPFLTRVKAFTEMSPEERERLAYWTADQLALYLPLLDYEPDDALIS